MLAGHLLPHRLADVLAERDRGGRAPARRGRCPIDSPASARSRSWPSPPGRPRSPYADTPGRAGRRPARASFHHSMNFGCHDSRARCSRRSPARSTLFGIFASMSTGLMCVAMLSRPRSVEDGPRARAEAAQRALAVRRRSGVGRSSSATPTSGRRSWSRWSPDPRNGSSPPWRSSASGEKLFRSSSSSRTSSSQSRSSNAKVTSSASTASAAVRS